VLGCELVGSVDGRLDFIFIEFGTVVTGCLQHVVCRIGRRQDWQENCTLHQNFAGDSDKGVERSFSREGPTVNFFKDFSTGV